MGGGRKRGGRVSNQIPGDWAWGPAVPPAISVGLGSVQGSPLPGANALREAEVTQSLHPDFGCPPLQPRRTGWSQGDQDGASTGKAKKLPALSTEGQITGTVAPWVPSTCQHRCPTRHPARQVPSILDEQLLPPGGPPRGRKDAQGAEDMQTGQPPPSTPAPSHGSGRHAPRSVLNSREAHQRLAVPCVARSPLGEPPETHAPHPHPDTCPSRPQRGLQHNLP